MKGFRRRAFLIVVPPPLLMQQEGRGVEGLMEKLMISMKALLINWTSFRSEADVYCSAGAGLIKWGLLRQA